VTRPTPAPVPKRRKPSADFFCARPATTVCSADQWPPNVGNVRRNTPYRQVFIHLFAIIFLDVFRHFSTMSLFKMSLNRL
jgi:hypothetical protein